MPHESVFAAVDISKAYGGFHLSNVSVSVSRGTVLGLVGLNGAGKSTFMKCCLGLVSADSGKVLVNGKPYSSGELRRSQLIGFVPERPTFYEWMTVEQMLAFASKFYAKWDSQLQAELLARFRLDPAKPISRLSHGMREKLSLIMALAFRPKLLFLDEPTSGLDPIMRTDFLDELRHLIGIGQVDAAMISSHVLGEIAGISSHIAILHDGQVKQHGSLPALTRQWKRVYFRLNSLTSPQRLEGRRLRFLGSGRYYAVVSSSDTGFLDTLQRRGASDVEEGEPSTEELLFAAIAAEGVQ